VCINLQFKAQILSIDRSNSNDDVEPANDDVEDQTAAETQAAEPSVSNFVTNCLVKLFSVHPCVPLSPSCKIWYIVLPS